MFFNILIMGMKVIILNNSTYNLSYANKSFVSLYNMSLRNIEMILLNDFRSYLFTEEKD